MAKPDKFIPSEESSLALFVALREAKFCHEPLTPLGGIVQLRDGSREVLFAAETADPVLPNTKITLGISTRDDGLQIQISVPDSNISYSLHVDPTRRHEMITLLNSLEPAETQLPEDH